MKNRALQDLINKFPGISEREKEFMLEEINVKDFKKGDIIQSQGEIAKSCFYLLDGSVRKFRIIEDKEKTLDFFTKKNAAMASESFSNKSPSDFSLICIEPTTLIVSDPEKDLKMFSKVPVLVKIVNQMLENKWYDSQQKLYEFRDLSPKKRYLKFMREEPELFNKVPNYQIASYLGLTPESLSRIRKRIAL